MVKRFLGPMLLFVAALIWGSSFVVLKDAVSDISPNALLGVRFALATLLMALVFINQVKTIRKQDLFGGVLSGIVCYCGYIVQTWGLIDTTPGKNAFITATYCAIIPFFVWMRTKERPNNYHFIAALIAIIGIGFISLTATFTINKGDLLTLISAFFYAYNIIIVTYYMKKSSPVKLTIIQFGTMASLALFFAGIFGEYRSLVVTGKNVWQILYLAVFATGIATLCQNFGQTMVGECEAGLILSLESVFGVFFSIIFYQEVITTRIFIGFVLVLIAVIISQTKLEFVRGGKK